MTERKFKIGDEVEFVNAGEEHRILLSRRPRHRGVVVDNDPGNLGSDEFTAAYGPTYLVMCINNGIDIPEGTEIAVFESQMTRIKVGQKKKSMPLSMKLKASASLIERQGVSPWSSGRIDPLKLAKLIREAEERLRELGYEEPNHERAEPGKRMLDLE